MKASFLPDNSTQAGSDFDAVQVFKRLLEYLWRHKGLLGLAIVFMVLTALTEASLFSV